MRRAKTTFRRGLCWYGQAAVNRFDAGSIPAAGASVELRYESTGRINAESPEGSDPNGEDAVSKTAAALPLQVRILSLPLWSQAI